MRILAAVYSAADAVGLSTNSNERPTHFPLTRLSALSCTLLIGATANRPFRGFVVLCTLANAQRFGAPVLLAAPSAAHVLSAFVRRAVPRPPCLPAAGPGTSSFRPVAAFVQRAEPRPPCLRLSSRRHTETLHEGTFFFMNALNSS